jgi:hypothetical protein
MTKNIKILLSVKTFVWISIVLGVLFINPQIKTLNDEIAEKNNYITTLNNNIRKLSYNTASGGGVNLKMMPDPDTGEATVRMEEVFSFDRNHAMCRVDTNPERFVMPTYAMGDVTIEANQFFMAMYATSIDKYELITTSDGSTKVRMEGGLDCITEVGQANVKFGDRNIVEHATFRIEAVDGGFGGGKAGDTFVFTAYFDEKESPLNYKIFGPSFKFTGEMIHGEITIIDPKK